MQQKKLIIGLDFDGTCTTHDYPNIGRDIGAVPVLEKIRDKGHRIILYTMRCGKQVDEASKWLKEHGIELYGINHNPGQRSWTKSIKVYCNIYIDDAALGCPLIFNEKFHERPYVDWPKVEQLLTEQGVI